MRSFDRGEPLLRRGVAAVPIHVEPSPPRLDHRQREIVAIPEWSFATGEPPRPSNLVPTLRGGEVGEAHHRVIRVAVSHVAEAREARWRLLLRRRSPWGWGRGASPGWPARPRAAPPAPPAGSCRTARRRAAPQPVQPASLLCSRDGCVPISAPRCRHLARRWVAGWWQLSAHPAGPGRCCTVRRPAVVCRTSEPVRASRRMRADVEWRECVGVEPTQDYDVAPQRF